MCCGAECRQIHAEAGFVLPTDRLTLGRWAELASRRGGGKLYKDTKRALGALHPSPITLP